jgi:hypothetical protein
MRSKSLSPGEIVPTHCQRPRRGSYGPGAHAGLTPQRDNVARLSYSVSNRSKAITQNTVSRVLDRPLSHVTVTRKVEPVAGPSGSILVAAEPVTVKG